MRHYLMGILFGCAVMMTGCQVSTPIGTARLTFDKEETAASNTIKIGDKEFDISAANPKELADKLLDNVALPEGTDTAQLKQFVYDNLQQLGIDLESVDFDSDEVSSAISDALTAAGVEMEDSE